MKKLSRNEGIAVSTALVFTFAILFFGSLVFQSTTGSGQGGQAAVSQSDNSSSAVKAGDIVAINYTGMLTNGTKFDSSYDRGQPIKFVVGKGQVIKGFDDGVVGMRVGEKRRLTISPNNGYGSQAVGAIPANSTLVFDVELVSIGQ